MKKIPKDSGRICLNGRVVRGQGLGRGLGVPTANLRASLKGIPSGVYLVRVDGAGLAGRIGVCNIGLRPTVSGGRRRRAEVHIPGFDGDLYGATLIVRLVEKLRDEKKFSGLAQLKAQIRRDIRRALARGRKTG